jgi:hypothetical protein
VALTNFGQFEEAERVLVHNYRSCLAKLGKNNASTQVAARSLITLYTSWGNQPGKISKYNAVLASPQEVSLRELGAMPFANAVIPPPAEKVTKAIADQIIGTWVLVASDRPSTPSGIGCRLQTYTRTHWLMTQPDPQTGLVVFHLGWRYTFEGDIMTQRIDFADASNQSVIGGSGRFKIAIDGDVYKQIDVDRGSYNSTSKRYKPTQPSTKQDRK